MMCGRHVSLRKSHGLAVVAAGAAAGFVASLALSALILLAERVAGLPIGTFYLVLVSSISQAADYSILAIAQGLLLHLLAGTGIGIILSAPFAVSKKSVRDARRAVARVRTCGRRANMGRAVPPYHVRQHGAPLAVA